MLGLYRILVVTVLKWQNHNYLWQNAPLLNKKELQMQRMKRFGDYQVHTRTFFF